MDTDGVRSGLVDELPLDLEAICRDDALFDALGRGGLLDSSDKALRALAGWRRAVCADPIPELVSIEEALAVIAVSRRRRSMWAWTKLVVEFSLYTLVILYIASLVLG